MEFNVGDKVWHTKEGIEGTVMGVDEGDNLPYYVRWGNESVSTWMYRSEVGLRPEEPTEDVVNHPAHYNTGKIEVIDFIEDQGLEYHEGNAVKYISRAGKKNPDTRVEDLQKAVWYLTRLVDTLLLKGENDG